jgi:hypothetical protein
LYVVPRPVVDAILPLAITPAPSGIARVFVGRMELVTPATEKTIKDALMTNQLDALRPYGRFLQAIGRRVIADSEEGDRPWLQQRLLQVSAGWMNPQNHCGS